MATDCSSLKPSVWRRLTNFRVSKWWSLGRAGVAWNARRAGLKVATYTPLCRMGFVFWVFGLVGEGCRETRALEMKVREEVEAMCECWKDEFDEWIVRFKGVQPWESGRFRPSAG